MGYGIPSLVLAAALLSAGCASPRRLGLASAERPRPRAGARAEFAPPMFHEVFAAAVEVVRRRGLDLVQCEAPRGALATAPVERDARCGGTTCLARDTTRVKLGYRAARVRLTREVWDPTLRGWRELDDPSTAEELSREERAIMAGVLTTARPPAADRRDRVDPCAPAPCGGGTCLAARVAPPR